MPDTQEPDSPPSSVSSSRQFPDWLIEHELSLAFTTYQAGRLFLIGTNSERKLSIFERFFNRSMGLYATDDGLWLSSLYQLWRFTNALQSGQGHEGYDRLYVPRQSFTTGDLDIHDVAVDGEGRVVFVNTLFSCLATTSADHSFTPLWSPPFISKLAAEDRCHMNGLAMQDGKPRYVTAVSQSGVADGWRDRRTDGGCVIGVPDGEIIVDGLSMPHSPRVHDGKLWVLNSGTGWFGYVDTAAGKFEPVTFCPGYARGLAFHKGFAIVGLSKPRDGSFSGLELEDNLAARDAEARSGLIVIDLKSGDIVHWLRLEGLIEELYDVAILPGVRRPMALGFKTDEIRRLLSSDAPQPL
ncbi:MAG: TIGR03032 family protein [Alphaproteobacteria bacterium]